MIDPKKIEEWKALTEAATPGPWSADDRDPKTGYLCGAIVVQVPAVGARVEGRGVIANVRHDGPRHRPDANAAFIAAAREALPALLAEREEREALLGSAVSEWIAEREEMLAVLREVEWRGPGWSASCPSCDNLREFDIDHAAHVNPGVVPGHAPDCRLAALLGRTP